MLTCFSTDNNNNGQSDSCVSFLPRQATQNQLAHIMCVPKWSQNILMACNYTFFRNRNAEEPAFTKYKVETSTYWKKEGPLSDETMIFIQVTAILRFTTQLLQRTEIRGCYSLQNISLRKRQAFLTVFWNYCRRYSVGQAGSNGK